MWGASPSMISCTHCQQSADFQKSTTTCALVQFASNSPGRVTSNLEIQSQKNYMTVQQIWSLRFITDVSFLASTTKHTMVCVASVAIVAAIQAAAGACLEYFLPILPTASSSPRP